MRSRPFDGWSSRGSTAGFAVAMCGVAAVALGACAAAPPVASPVPDGGYAAFSHFGTNPVVATTEERGARVGLAASHASLALVRHYLAHDVAPPPEAVRVEECATGLVDVAPGAAPRGAPEGTWSVETSLAPSPFRVGWSVLVATVRAPDPASSRPTASPLVVVSDAPDGPLERALAARGARLVEGRATALPTALQTAERAVFVGDGAGLGGPDAQRALLAAVADLRARGAILSVVARIGPGLDDALLERLATAGGGVYEALSPTAPDGVAPLADHLARAPGLTDVVAALRLDPARVARWRLVGHEGRAARAGAEVPIGGGLLAVGDAVDLVVELEVRPGADPLGRLRVTATEGTRDVAIADPPSGNSTPSARHRAVVVASALAEKLRGSYWMKDLAWDALLTELARVEPAAVRQRLLDLATAARAHLSESSTRELPITTLRRLP